MIKTLIALGITIPVITAAGLVFMTESELEIVKDGKSDYVIVYPDGADFAAMTAAKNLAKAVKSATGAEIKTVTDKADVTASPKNPERIVFSDEAEGLLYGDYSVKVNGNSLYISAEDPKLYSAAVKYITEKFIDKDGFCVSSRLDYIYRPDYEITSLKLCGSDIAEFSVVYTDEFSKEHAEAFAETVCEKTGVLLDVKDEKTDGKNVVFGLSDGSTDSYFVKSEGGNIIVSVSTGMGLEAAYEELYSTVFGKEGKVMNIENIDKQEKLTPTDEYKKFISVKDGISNTRKKLTENKKLNVAYYGGSVTVGHAASDREKYSWRARTTAWLKENFPDAEINEINAAIGASGSHLGAFRAERDIVSQKPDLLFIEFAINDSYNGESEASASENYEAIVRQVWEKYPECDIVNVYVTDSSRAAGTHKQADAHEKIAEAYGIPSLRVGNALVDKYSLRNGSANPQWKNFFTDIVHMTDKGFEEYFLCIREFLCNELIFGKDSEIVAHSIPENVMENSTRELKFITITPDMLETLSCKGYTYSDGVFQSLPKTPYNGYLTTSKEAGENSITFTFEGSELSLFMSTFTSGNIKYTIDGKNGYATRSSMNNPFPIVSGLEYGKHTITMQIMFGDTTTANIGGFLVR